VKPDGEQSQKSTETTQKQEPGNTTNQPAKRHIRSLLNDSEKRKGHHTKGYCHAQAGNEAEPGQELGGRVRPRPLQHNREHISSQGPEQEDGETKNYEKSCVDESGTP
jgi:hypothetical protein